MNEAILCLHMFIAINNEPCVSGDFHQQRSQVINYVRVTDESSWHVSKYAGSTRRTTWEAYFCQKRLVKNREGGKQRRFPITYKLLMSRRVKRGSSCGAFRFYPPPPSIHSQFCSRLSVSVSDVDVFMFIPSLIPSWVFLCEDEMFPETDALLCFTFKKLIKKK